MGGLHVDLRTALPLLERTANVEAQLELRRGIQQRLGGWQAEHPDEVVVQPAEAIAVLGRPDDVRVRRWLDPLVWIGYRVLFFAVIARMKDSTGMALSVSIDSVPRAPRLTETRAIASASLASTTFTKS